MAIHLYHNYAIIRAGRCYVILRGEGLKWFLSKHPEYVHQVSKITKDPEVKKCTSGN